MKLWTLGLIIFFLMDGVSDLDAPLFTSTYISISGIILLFTLVF